MTAMLYSVELRLTVAGRGDLRSVTGYHLYSFFLHLMERANPALAASLHEDRGPKPFTLSPLAIAGHGPGYAALPGKNAAPSEGTRARLRLTLLQEEVFAAFLDALWRLPDEPGLLLSGAPVSCDGLDTIPSQSPWAAITSFAELLENAHEERKLRLAFLSPTTFRSKGVRNSLFPEPSLVFKSLLARWNACAPPHLTLSLRGIDTSAVRLSAYRLATRMLDFGSYQELGFCGQATYELGESLESADVRAFQTLGAFAFYSGIGAKTTMSMGQARRVENAPSLPHRAGSPSKEGGRPTNSN